MTPEGWYDDPHGGAGYRWWDGSEWTDHTLPPDEPTQEDRSAAATEPADERVHDAAPAHEATTTDDKLPATQLPPPARSAADPTAPLVAASVSASTPAVPWPFEQAPSWCRACG